jgi:hypothetical protein
MFWGWFSSGDGGMRRGGGCIFLPFLFICGSFFLFDNFNSGWLLGLILVAVLWFVFSTMFSRANPVQVEDGSWDSGMFDDEKPKRDFAEEKPKRSVEYIERPDGEILEVIDPGEEDDGHPRDKL